MSTPTIPTFGPAAPPSLHALRGIRFIEGETGGAPAAQPGTAPDGAGTPAGANGTPPAGSEGQSAPPAAADGQQGTPESVDSLPEWAQREIRKARKEAGDYRTAKNDAERSLAELREQTAVALGLKQPAAPVDPALTAAQQQARQASIDLAVLRAASTEGVNADRLLDSARFLENARALDHTASDFPQQIRAAIAAAVAADPALKTARAAGSSGPDLGRTTGEQGPITEEQLANASPEQIVQWDDAGLLSHLL